MDHPRATTADWYSLTQILGHSSNWPEHWHTILAQHGQAALLQQASRDLATGVRSSGDEHTPIQPTRHVSA
ncbi:hypothetical protein GCM10017744_102790 [Streptomyces antimycoticus]|uniref:Uncharacterized protein n=2 Tax=Streptomyces TaxID=1883 RepID=A0A4D4KTY6_9ACTN|nr:hypothetical protein [Streptomyces antimycoticus]GDY49313.1 hypothetical protein SANT12839_101950 [Streptomyces antimycoticus]